MVHAVCMMVYRDAIATKNSVLQQVHISTDHKRSPAGWKYLQKVEIVCATAVLADYIVQKYSSE